MNRDLLRWTAASAFVAASFLHASVTLAQGAPPAPPPGTPPAASATPPGAPPVGQPGALPPGSPGVAGQPETFPPGGPMQPPAPPPPTPTYPQQAYPQQAYPQQGTPQGGYSYGQGGYAQGGYAQPGWQGSATPPPPPPDDRAHAKGVTDELNPYDQRGGIVIASSVLSAADGGLGGGSLLLQGRFHLAKHVYLDATVPLAMSVGITVGNPTLEVRAIAPLDSGRNFIVFGGGMGFPLLNDDTQDYAKPAQAAVAANAMWDVHLFAAWTIPMIGRFGTQHYLGRLAILRTELDPVLLIPHGDNEEPELQLQHAVEFQLGQVIGGGLRVQGVALPTWENADNELRMDGDLYQLAIEPFFSYEGDLFAGRLGLMLPLDEQLGPPIDRSWGFRMGLGGRFD